MRFLFAPINKAKTIEELQILFVNRWMGVTKSMKNIIDHLK